MINTTFLITLISAYLIGGIPTGYLLGWWHAGIDVTQHGSGNIGATNVARILGKRRYFLFIFMIDALKAVGVLCFAKFILLSDQTALVALACAVLLGNGFSPFLGLRGGKGVATSAGVLAFFMPAGVVAWYGLWWAALLSIFRRVDVASMGCVIGGASVAAWWYRVPAPLPMLAWVIAGWVIVRHHRNIGWILRGE